MNVSDNEEQLLDFGMAAGEVGFEAMSSLMKYYPTMLGSCFATISELTGVEPDQIRATLEKELGLTGVFEESVGKLKATKEVMGSIIESLEKESHENDLDD